MSDDLVARLRKVIEGQGLSMQAMGNELRAARARIAELEAQVAGSIKLVQNKRVPFVYVDWGT